MSSALCGSSCAKNCLHKSNWRSADPRRLTPAAPLWNICGTDYVRKIPLRCFALTRKLAFRRMDPKRLRIFAPRIPKFWPPEYWMGFLQAHQSRSAQSMTRDSAISHPDLTTAGSVLSVGTSLQLRTRSRSVKPRIETTVAQKLILSVMPPFARL
jgi:hypothetical protein